MTNDNPEGPLGDLQVLPVSALLLDAANPRLPQELRGEEDQRVIAINMAEIFDALSIARSIARFGFYPWEALVVVPTDSRYLVVEGNRRLTALRGLLDRSLREEFEDSDQWHIAARDATRAVPTEVPCVVVPSRRDATPALGYRHISGIKPWEPQMQARFVSSLIDNDTLTYTQVAELTGQTRGWVQETYSTFKVFETAESLGVDTSGANDAYSLLTVAMSTKELRDHIGAERAVAEGTSPIATPDKAKVAEVFEWVFGSDSAEPVANESREIRTLAKVVSKPAGLAAIRAGLSLEEAKQKVEDADYNPRDVLKRDLERAESILNRLDLTKVQIDQELSKLVDGIAEQTQRLLNEVDAEES